MKTPEENAPDLVVGEEGSTTFDWIRESTRTESEEKTERWLGPAGHGDPRYKLLSLAGETGCPHWHQVHRGPLKRHLREDRPAVVYVRLDQAEAWVNAAIEKAYQAGRKSAP